MQTTKQKKNNFLAGELETKSTELPLVLSVTSPIAFQLESSWDLSSQSTWKPNTQKNACQSYTPGLIE